MEVVSGRNGTILNLQVEPRKIRSVNTEHHCPVLFEGTSGPVI